MLLPIHFNQSKNEPRGNKTNAEKQQAEDSQYTQKIMCSDDA